MGGVKIRDGRGWPKKTTPRQDRYLRIFALRNQFRMKSQDIFSMKNRGKDKHCMMLFMNREDSFANVEDHISVSGFFFFFFYPKNIFRENRFSNSVFNLSLAEHDMPCLSKQCRSRSVGF